MGGAGACHTNLAVNHSGFQVPADLHPDEHPVRGNWDRPPDLHFMRVNVTAWRSGRDVAARRINDPYPGSVGSRTLASTEKRPLRNRKSPKVGDTSWLPTSEPDAHWNGGARQGASYGPDGIERQRQHRVLESRGHSPHPIRNLCGGDAWEPDENGKYDEAESHQDFSA